MRLAGGALDLVQQGSTGRCEPADAGAAVVVADRTLDQLACFEALERARRRRAIQSNISG